MGLLTILNLANPASLLGGRRSSLLRRYKVELSRPFLVEERAFGFIAAAPMFVSTRHKKEFAWPNTLFSSVIFIQVRAFDDDQGNIVRVGVHTRIVSRIEFSECCMRALVRVAP